MEKILTFSFDDGTLQDRKLVKLFNKYNLKCTFNLNSLLLSENESCEKPPIGNRKTICKGEVKDLYKGHEIAVHTLLHTRLPDIKNDEEIIKNVEEDRLNLSNIVGYEVVGMAYPCGGVNNDDRVANIIKNNTGVKYARTITDNFSFAPQDNLYRFNPTSWQGNTDKLNLLLDEFLNYNGSERQIFYVWGHSFEFDEHNAWDKFEDFLKRASNQKGVKYLTNKEAFEIK